MAPMEPKETGRIPPPLPPWFGNGEPAPSSPAAASPTGNESIPSSPPSPAPGEPPEFVLPAVPENGPLIPPEGPKVVDPTVVPATAIPSTAIPATATPAPEAVSQPPGSPTSPNPAPAEHELELAPQPTPATPVYSWSTPSDVAQPAEPTPAISAAAAGASHAGAETIGLAPVPGSPPTPPPPPTEAGEAEEPSLLQLYVGYAPAWLASFIFHMMLMIGLAALVFTLPTPSPPVVIKLEKTVDFDDVEEGEDVEIQEMIPEEPVEIIEPEPAEIAEEMETPLEDTDLAPEDEPNIESLEDVGEFQKAGVASDSPARGSGPKNQLSGRSKGMKKRLLARHGGTAKTESAVTAGLWWLTRQQRRNGEWRLDAGYSDASQERNSKAASAMALLAFQGAGYTHKTGEVARFRSAVRRGWYWLLGRQAETGSFAEGTPSHHHFYTHALCTFALCELYAMTQDSRYRDRAQLAVDYLVNRQDSGGGWRYRQSGSDLSVSGWAMMALQSARIGNLEVPEKTMKRLSKFLDKVSSEYGSKYGYLPGSSPSRTMTAEGLLCRQYLGWDQDHSALITGARYLLRKPINYKRGQNVYYWYYATQVLHHMEGDMWEEWNRVLSEEVPAQQVTDGRERGSWDPDDDHWGDHGGRLYTTCLSIYMLEVYYRHLPIYSMDMNLRDIKRRDRARADERKESADSASGDDTAEQDQPAEEEKPLLKGAGA